MADTDAFSNIILNVISIIISATLPVFILYYFKNKERRDVEKEKEVKETAERTAHELKESTERHAREVKESNERTAKDLEKDTVFRNEKLAMELKSNTSTLASELKASTATIANDLKHATDIKYGELLEKMNIVTRTMEEIRKWVGDVNSHVDDITRSQHDTDRTMEQMIHALQDKAELTNGNVEKIRTDLLILQEDVDDICDKISGGDTGSMAEKRDRKRKRSERRNEITSDAQKQPHH